MQSIMWIVETLNYSILCFDSLYRRLEKRLEFETRRKLHYNEFEAVRRARQLMEQDEDNDEDVENDHSNITANGNDSNMDMDDDGSGTSTSSAAAVRL